MSVMSPQTNWSWKNNRSKRNSMPCQADFKLISVEEVQEINLPQENWVSTIARTGFGGDSEGEVTLYDLIK